MYKFIRFVYIIVIFSFLGFGIKSTYPIPVTGFQNKTSINLIDEKKRNQSSILDSSILIVDQKEIFKIVEQPRKMYEYVSNISFAVTRYQFAEEHGSIGLLAHNFLAGEYFSDLQLDDQISIAAQYENKEIQYSVSEILEYQALDPDNVNSWFKNLKTGNYISASDLAFKIYDRPGNLILQTCIEKNGDSEWGRLFVIAEPLFIVY